MSPVDAETLDHLIPRLYQELRRRAHQALVRARPGETLSTTALVHETYLRFRRSEVGAWNDRAHFLAAAGRAMRHIVVDYARRRTALKRGGPGARVVLDEGLAAVDACAAEMVALDAALDGLATINRRLVEIVELRFFAGLSLEETAAVLEVSSRTVKRDWQKAKAFLYRALEGGEAPAPEAPA